RVLHPNWGENPQDRACGTRAGRAVLSLWQLARSSQRRPTPMLPELAKASPRLGPYTLVQRLAQGGMATVYKARLDGPGGFEKTVVVKAMLPALAIYDELVQLFCAEARLSAQLNHPNIVQVLDFGVDDGIPYLVMEHLDGWTVGQLRDRL